MRTILVVAEHFDGVIDDSAYELAAAARGLEGVDQVTCAVLGAEVAGLAEELTAWFDHVHAFEHPRLDPADGDARGAALLPLIERHRPFATLIPHSNTGMDLAGPLSIRADVPLIGDCLSLEVRDDALAAVRAAYGGKARARVVAAGSPNGYMATVRPGALTAPASPPGAGGEVHDEEVADSLAPKRRFRETIEPPPGAVDLSQAEVLVAVGRGIEDEENLELVESLAEAMGAELACTRPVVDKGWLEKPRQVGTSGATVSPRIYLTVGVSGSFQHMGGVKGKPFIAAINHDAAAPIFDVADVGIVADLFDIVPLLEEKLRGG